MRDVAALAGVSLKTVSRVVNDEAGVSSALAQRVQRAAEQLGYRHNLAASNLRRGRRTGTIALLVQDLSNDFSAELLRAIDDTMRERGFVVLSTSLDEESAREREVVSNLIARRVDGLIMMPASVSQAYLQPEIAAGFAVVMIDRKPRHLDTDYVVVDNVAGAQDATNHLIAHGHRRIALVSDEPSIPTALDRRLGYVNALQAAGIAVDETLIRSGRTEAAYAEAVRELLALPDPPTALFTARNAATIGAARVLRELGLAYTIALVGFDDIARADLIEPGLTTVVQDPARVGREAANLLFARLNGADDEPHGLVLPTAMRLRGSGEIRPAR
jgi:LacI family transcriptional regulator